MCLLPADVLPEDVLPLDDLRAVHRAEAEAKHTRPATQEATLCQRPQT